MNDSHFHEFAAAVNHSIIGRNYNITHFRVSPGLIEMDFRDQQGTFFSANFWANRNGTWTSFMSGNLRSGNIPTAENPYDLLTHLHHRLDVFEHQRLININNGMVQNNQNIYHGRLDF